MKCFDLYQFDFLQYLTEWPEFVAHIPIVHPDVPYRSIFNSFHPPWIQLMPPSHHRQEQRCQPRQPNHEPSSLLHLLVGDHATGIPDQMPNAIERVEGEGQADGEFRREFCRDGPGREPRGQAGGLEMPSRQGRGEVSEAEDVEGTREGDAGQSVEHGEVPCDLRAVDAQMRSDGAVQALLRQDGGGGFGVGELGCLHQAVRVSTAAIDEEKERGGNGPALRLCLGGDDHGW